MSARLISIIGPPAVGKTTLAEFLSAELPAEMICEDFAGNPFLADSYTSGGQARLGAQLWYLLSRVSQLGRATWPDEGLFVSDYGYCQDRIFAHTRLDARDLAAYESVAAVMDARVHPPDLLVHMDAETSVLQQRMAARGRAFEAAITGDFLADLRRRYNDAAVAAESPVLDIDSGVVDIRDNRQRRKLIVKIRSLL